MILKKNILISILLIIFILATACTSTKNTTGEIIATEEGIYEEESTYEDTYENQTNEIIINETQQEPIDNLSVPEEKIDEFKFPNSSIVSTQHNVSLSLDDLKHEVKSGYWGKIIEITATVLNKGEKAFKPKLLVLLYDEKDPKEEWFKLKAEIEFDIPQLNIGEHITRQAIVSIPFDDILIAKNFRLILVDASDPANKAIVVVEKEFKAI